MQHTTQHHSNTNKTLYHKYTTEHIKHAITNSTDMHDKVNINMYEYTKNNKIITHMHDTIHTNIKKYTTYKPTQQHHAIHETITINQINIQHARQHTNNKYMIH